MLAPQNYTIQQNTTSVGIEYEIFGNLRMRCDSETLERLNWLSARGGRNQN